jgi:hypothetical protein
MNTDIKSEKISGTIAAHDDPVLYAQFAFTINTSNNKVTYTIICYWKKRNIRGECPFNNYKDAAIYFEGLPAVSQIEMV